MKFTHTHAGLFRPSPPPVSISTAPRRDPTPKSAALSSHPLAKNPSPYTPTNRPTSLSLSHYITQAVFFNNPLPSPSFAQPLCIVLTLITAAIVPSVDPLPLSGKKVEGPLCSRFPGPSRRVAPGPVCPLTNKLKVSSESCFYTDDEHLDSNAAPLPPRPVPYINE